MICLLLIMGELWFSLLLISMNTKIMFWNCQDMGHPRFHNIVVEYRRDFSSNIFFFLDSDEW